MIVATDRSASTIAAAGRVQLLGPGVDVEVVTVGGADEASIAAAIPGPGLLPQATAEASAGPSSHTPTGGTC